MLQLQDERRGDGIRKPDARLITLAFLERVVVDVVGFEDAGRPVEYGEETRRQLLERTWDPKTNCGEIAGHPQSFALYVLQRVLDPATFSTRKGAPAGGR